MLPRDEARPWPRWLARLLGPGARALARRLDVEDAGSLRAWLVGLLLTAAPAAASPHGAERRLPLRRQPLDLLDALREALHPYARWLRGHAAVLLERYVATVSSAWSSAGTRLRLTLVALATAVLAIVATTPLGLEEQAALGLVIWAAALLVREIPRQSAALILMALSLVASSRYIWWRLTQTLDLNPGIEFVLGLGLLAAELYTWTILALGYLQNARPLGREPLPLPEDRDLWPSVDVLIPTLNEPLAVVAPTVLAALALDWPVERLNVYLLDDGGREEFRDFAATVGARYLARTEHAHAKAGNLNHALGRSDGEFIAVFDCDHIPVRAFLTTTLGWLLRDPRCALVQTPHHFFSPDPFERNLGTFRQVPSEGDLFYGLVQDGNDLWNAAFFCGSCAVLRRAALLEIGGIAADTVTEDAQTALTLHRHGYTSAYIRRVLAGGLAADNLASHIRQRIRWARGMAQIFRLDNPLLGPGLTPFQRLCYANAMLHFFAGLPRLVFLTAPLAYLFFEFHVINAAAVTLAAYALPHLVQAALANSHIQRRFRHSVWNEAYEAALSWYTALPTLLALINPRSGRFNVTAKGGLVAHEYFDWRIALPYIVLALANLGGALLAIPRILFWNTFEADTVVINLVWTLFNLTLLGAVVGVAAETIQRRGAPRVLKSLPAYLHLADGQVHACQTIDFSLKGLRLKLPEALRLAPGAQVRIGLDGEMGELHFAAEAREFEAGTGRFAFAPMSLADQSRFVQCTFARPDVWLDWNAGTLPDRPLRSLAEVLSFGATGYLRLFGKLSAALRARLARAAGGDVRAATG